MKKGLIGKNHRCSFFHPKKMEQMEQVLEFPPVHDGFVFQDSARLKEGKYKGSRFKSAMFPPGQDTGH